MATLCHRRQHRSHNGPRADLLNDMAESYPDNTIAAAGDIADTSAFTATLDSIITRLGKIDLAIVCAGIGELNPGLDTATELSTVAVNVTGWTNAVDTLYQLFTHKTTATS